MEETKESVDPLLKGFKSDILFTTMPKDPENVHLDGKPVTFAAINIPSFMGGRANPWH